MGKDDWQEKIEKAKEAAKLRLPDYLQTSRGADLRKNIRCIHPENHNNGDKTPSARYKAAWNVVRCPVCNKSYDIFNFIEADYGIHDFMGQLRKACVMYNIDFEEPKPAAPAKPQEPQPEPAPEYDFTKAIDAATTAALNSIEALAYYAGRGLDENDIRKYKLGFMPWNKLMAEYPALQREYWDKFKYIIPYPGAKYLAARNEAATGEKDKYRFPTGLKKCLYYLEREDAAISPVVVVEGQFDAIAVNKLGASAVATGGNGASLLTEWAKANGIREAIIATDNDKAGETEAAANEKALQAAGVITYIADSKAMYGDFKDAGEAAKDEAQRDKMVEVLLDAVENITNIKEEKEQERQRNTGAGVIDSFLETVQSRRYEPIKTGFLPFDEITGGLTRQTLVMLAAAPGTGKTTITAQLFEGMARRGHKVIFINLEMSREQLIARSLSRYAYGVLREDLPAKKILRGYEWDEKTRQQVYAAANGYKKDIAGNLMYYDREKVSADLGNIIDFLDEEAAHEEAEGRPAPLVVIDYLHILESKDRNGREEETVVTIKKSVTALKAFAIRHNSVVFAIIATNRESNKGKKMTLESGRDTSNIEYSADIFLGLNYAAWEEGLDTTIEEEKGRIGENGRSCRLLTLKLLKARMEPDAKDRKILLDAEHGIAEAVKE